MIFLVGPAEPFSLLLLPDFDDDPEALDVAVPARPPDRVGGADPSSVRATLELLLELFCDGLVSLLHRLLGLSGFKLLIPLDFFFTGLLLASLLRFLVGLPGI